MGRFFLFAIITQAICLQLHSQSKLSYDSITHKLKEADKEVRLDKCKENTDAGANDTRQEGKIITNPALNLFFANKIASFLTDGGDLSLFGSYATLETGDGRFSFNHNLWVKKNDEGRIRKMTTLGFQADILDGFAGIFSGESFSKGLGFSIKQTWFHRGVVLFDRCSQRQVRGLAPQAPEASRHKEIMNVKRAMIIAKIENEIEAKAKEFERQLELANIPDAQKQSLRDGFYSSMHDAAFDQFAEMQYDALEETKAYHQIRTSWTSAWGYVPVSSKTYEVAPSFPGNFSEQKVYPWEFNLRHSRIWESSRLGRFFFSIEGGAFGNNNINTGDMNEVQSNQYLTGTSAGPDTLNLGEIGSDEVYIGTYQAFTTPFLKTKFVWFPKDFFAGLSLSIEKNFGKYNPLDGKIGLPMRIDDSEGNPSINIELQLRISDITGSIFKDKSFIDKSAIGISVGLPFTSFLY